MRYELRTERCWPSEREVAAEVRIEVDADRACGVLDSVPFWFHTFALNRGLGLYTPGAARDHGYRLASIPDSFAGLRVLDVGAFDGFYSFPGRGTWHETSARDRQRAVRSLGTGPLGGSSKVARASTCLQR